MGKYMDFRGDVHWGPQTLGKKDEGYGGLFL